MFTGLVILEFTPMKWSDVGDYKCVAENELGEATLVVKLKMAGMYIIMYTNDSSLFFPYKGYKPICFKQIRIINAIYALDIK